MEKRKKDVPFVVPQWPATTVEMWPLGKIKPYPQNPRTHPPAQIEQLARDMRDDGVTMPILVDEGGVVIAGHGRKLAAEANKFEKYPVVIARGWTAEQKRAARLKDNAVAALSGWDGELIKAEVGSLKLSGYDIALLGFPEAQLRGWGLASETNKEPAATPPRPKKPIVRQGDRWALGDHVLVCGDATDKRDVAQCLGDGRVDLLLTDPPYGIGKKMQGGTWGAAEKYGDFRRWDVAPTAAQLTQLRALAKAAIIWGGNYFALPPSRCWLLWVKTNALATMADCEMAWTNLDQPAKCFHAAMASHDHGHPTEKPLGLIEWCLGYVKARTIFDPYCGTGTTIIAADMAGARAFGMELDPGYCQVIVERWQTATGKLATLGGKMLEEVASARRRRFLDRAAAASAPKGKGRRVVRPSSKASPAAPATSPNSG